MYHDTNLIYCDDPAERESGDNFEGPDTARILYAARHLVLQSQGKKWGSHKIYYGEIFY